MKSGGCPPVPSKNTADPSTSVTPYGVKKLSLFVRDTDTAHDMTNRNSADSKAMVLDAIYTAARAHSCAAGQQENGCQELPESVFAGAFAGRVVTSVVVEVNTFFGQFGACKKDPDDNAWHCAADWECWCDQWGGGGNGNSNPNPCLRNGDDGRLCMCDIWGGCGGGQWDGCPDGGCPAVADNALTVGRHSLAHAASSSLSAISATAVASAEALRALAVSAHEFSTTAGGRCSEDEEAKDSVDSFLGKDDSPFKGVCTWSLESSSHALRSADADCLEAAMLTAAEAAAENCLAQMATGETVRGSPGWIGCVAGGEAVKAAEHRLFEAFDRGLCTV